MHKFFTPKENIISGSGIITGDDVKHIYRVLRLTEGEKVILNDCDGKEYLSEISEITKTEVSLKILEELKINNESQVKIDLFQGIPKAAKMDLIVQKGTELGINNIIPVLTKRVDVKLSGDFKKLDRLNRIALEAAKQSKRTIIPQVSKPVDFDTLLQGINDYDIFLVPYENAEDTGLKSVIRNVNNIKKVGILIGPEGGFEQEEIDVLIEKGANIITLGKRILRTETAGFVTTALVQYELGDLGGVI